MEDLNVDVILRIFKFILKEEGCKSADWIQLVGKRLQLWAFVGKL